MIDYLPWAFGIVVGIATYCWLCWRDTKVENARLVEIKEAYETLIAEKNTVIDNHKAACRKGKINSDASKAKAREERVTKTIADLPAALAPVDVAA